MDPRELETLRAVRRHGGVTAAAATLGLTPSAVSQQLAALQRRAGVPLTRRVGRGLRLTPAGEALAEASVAVAVALERARSACDEFLTRPVGVVDVCAFQSAAWLLLPNLLDRVARLDGITVRCTDEDVAQDDFVALTDRIDIVVAHRPDPGPAWPEQGAGVRVVPLLREPLDVAVPVGHPVAGAERVTPAELRDEEWITVREGFPVAAILAAAAGTVGPPRISHRINDFHVVEALVAQGHGISLLPRHSCGRTPGVRMVPLAGVRAGRSIEALVRADRAERLVVRRVLAELRAVAAGIDRAPAGGSSAESEAESASVE
jgi:DNA-binding transcriptional LysR family regulator